MYFEGIIIGLISFLIIGILHPVVIKGEYYIGKKIWPIFLLSGVIFLILSMFLEDAIFSIISGVLGFSLLWSIHEVYEQEKRVKKGWFPYNPKRKK
ncbi:MAG: DUF4491 family protein [Methanobrevibacter sp.]|jgi:uncharacterized membrane protein|nr:DUF4491 family protein [Candidatus Methanovirga australis]